MKFTTEGKWLYGLNGGVWSMQNQKQKAKL